VIGMDPDRASITLDKINMKGKGAEGYKKKDGRHHEFVPYEGLEGANYINAKPRVCRALITGLLRATNGN